jgi:hypothetical protein
MEKLGKVFWGSAAVGVGLTTLGAILVRHRKAEEETPVEENVEVGVAPGGEPVEPTPIKVKVNTAMEPKIRESQKTKPGESSKTA